MLAQEFGLVVVIALIGLGLWAYTGSTTQSDVTPLVGATVGEAGPGEFTVTHEGRTRTYRESEGYSFRAGDDRVFLSHRYQVNRFLSRDNLVSVLTSASYIAIMAVGMTGIIIMGGIDLSVGSIYALSAVLASMVLEGLVGTMNSPMTDPAGIGVAVLVTLAICCGVGALCGFVNGASSVGLGVHPFIITLGGMAVYRGIAFVTTKGQTLGPFPEFYTAGFGKFPMLGTTPVPMLVMAAVGLVGALVLTRTVFGRRTFAIGGNEIAAKYAGIPVGWTKVWLFTLCGLLAGLSAAIAVGYYGAAASNFGQGYELSVIAAAVVGGASLSGGRGTAIGAVLGAIVIALIENSINVTGADENYRQIIIGAAIVLAVVIDQTKQRLTAR